MKPERLVAIKRQALRSISDRAHNPNNAGVTMIAISPHEALEMVAAIDERLSAALETSAGRAASGSGAGPTARRES